MDPDKYNKDLILALLPILTLNWYLWQIVILHPINEVFTVVHCWSSIWGKRNGRYGWRESERESKI